MASSLPRLRTKARTPRQPATRTGTQGLMAPAPALPDRTRQRQPEEPDSWNAAGGLRCLWYDTGLADTLTAVDEFLRTPVGTAALADFCRARRGGPAPELDARALLDAVGSTAARLRD
jgi:hypothetical protein